MQKKFNLCKSTSNAYFIEKLEDKEYVYLRTDADKNMKECINIFKSITNFGEFKNNDCSMKKYDKPYNVIFTFDTIIEIENYYNITLIIENYEKNFEFKCLVNNMLLDSKISIHLDFEEQLSKLTKQDIDTLLTFINNNNNNKIEEKKEKKKIKKIIQ